MKRIILVVILSITYIACKNESKESVQNETEKQIVEETKKEFTVKLNFKTNKEDSFKIMLNNIQVDELQKKNIQVIEKVSPTTTTEMFTANFGENFSNNLIIGLGNKEIKTIEITSIELTYGNNSINISSNQISNYFVLNKFISQDENTFTLKTNKVGGKLNPNLIAKRKIFQELTK